MSSTLSAGTLKVTTPNGGNKWKSGKKYAIKWVKGNGGAFVKIQLLKSNKHYKWVTKKTKNDGKHTWKIPSTLKAGKTYKIKITSRTDKTVNDATDKNFTIFAANPVYDDNYTYNGKRYYAKSTGGVKNGIGLSKVHKRSKKSRGSVKFIVFTQKCVRGNASALHDDDCDQGIRRSQLQQYDELPINRDLEYRFSVKKPYKKYPGLNGDYYINFFEIKPMGVDALSGGDDLPTVPTFRLILDGKTSKLRSAISLRNHSYSDVEPLDIYNDKGRLKPGWNDFKIKTKQTAHENGYVEVYHNGRLIYSYKGKTAYKDVHTYKLGLQFWMGGYICCGQGDKLEKNEADHIFYFDMVKARRIK